MTKISFLMGICCFLFCIFFLFSCGVKAPPLPPLPVTPEQTEVGRPVPVPSPSPVPKAKLRKAKGVKRSQ